MRPGPVTLNDVARAADVAVSTVSRALKNPERVSPATRRHVQAIAQRLGYQHGRASLPTGTSMLALVVYDITNPYNFGVIRGAEAQARAAGYTLVIGDAQISVELEATSAERLQTSVDGLILAGSRQSPDQLRALRAHGPAVLFNREVAGFSSVVTDSLDGSRQIIEHLAALGHRTVTYLSGPADAWMDGERRRGLAAAAATAGITLTATGPFLPTLEQGAAAADVGLGTGATALVAFNDLLAIGVLQRLGRRGVDVPGEVSVVGFDDIFGSDFCHPPLTTVTGPVDAAGRSLVDLVLAEVGSDVPDDQPARSHPRIVLPAQLRIRESTGPVASV